jgi:hypothetical protein
MSEVENCLSWLYEHVLFLKNKNLIRPETIKKFGWVLTQFQQLNLDYNEILTKNSCEVSALVEKIDKLTCLLRISGMSNELITDVLKLPSDYLKKQMWELSEKNQCLKSDIDFDALNMIYRQIEQCIDADIQTITIYKNVRRLGETEVVEDFLSETKNQFPHLLRFFLIVDSDNEPSINQTRSLLRKYYYDKN